jgi:heme/copper-type cytochrome/quinol oxidase subunit 2
MLTFRLSTRSLTWLLLALAGLTIALAPLPTAAAAPVERVFHIEASSFEYKPGLIHVNPGDRVTIELAATDVVHGLYLDGYGLSLEADPGKTERLTFTADRTGTFRFRCSVTCGPLHPFMIGKMRVGGNDLLWRAGGLALLGLAAILWWGRR